jgi:hypothetical protein
MNNNSGFSQAGASERKPAPTQLSQSNYYERLGIKPNASVQDIRRAYRDLSKLYHPDTTELESAIAIPNFQALNEAYATLSSPEKRLTYDYKTGFSRMSVMQSFAQGERPPQNRTPSNAGSPYSSNAYLDPTDRPLSAGEFFAVFILGITFIACLLLVLTLSLTKGDVTLTDLGLNELNLNELNLEELDLSDLDLTRLNIRKLDRDLVNSAESSDENRQNLDYPQAFQPNFQSSQPNILYPSFNRTAPELP